MAEEAAGRNQSEKPDEIKKISLIYKRREEGGHRCKDRSERSGRERSERERVIKEGVWVRDVGGIRTDGRRFPWHNRSG